MNHKEFDKLLEKRFNKIRSTLTSKNKEYASGDDKLHNFKRAGKMLGCSQEKALIGMWTKHIISILDIVDKWNDKGEPPSIEQLDEKIGDAINYLILLEACFKEENSKKFKEKFLNLWKNLMGRKK